MEFLAFCQVPLFATIWEEVRSRLEAQAETTMLEYVNQFVLEGVGPCTTADFRCGLDVVPPGYSTYRGNCTEAFWKKLGAIHPAGTEHDDATAVFKNIHECVLLWMGDNEFGSIVPTPSGTRNFQPSLLRGEGLQIARGALYSDKGRRLTVAKLRQAAQESEVFKQFASGQWVAPKRDVADLCGESMKLFFTLMTGTYADIQSALCQASILVDGSLSIKDLKKLMQRFTLITFQGNGLIWDHHRDFIITGQSEHELFAREAFGGLCFEPLSGARALGKGKARAKTSAKGKAKARARGGLATPDRSQAPMTPQEQAPPPAHASLAEEVLGESDMDSLFGSFNSDVEGELTTPLSDQAFRPALGVPSGSADHASRPASPQQPTPCQQPASLLPSPPSEQASSGSAPPTRTRGAGLRPLPVARDTPWQWLGCDVCPAWHKVDMPTFLSWHQRHFECTDLGLVCVRKRRRRA